MKFPIGCGSASTGDEKKRLSNRPTLDAHAYQDYLRGRFYWNKRTADGVKKGIEYFQRAIEEGSELSVTICGLADSYNILGFYCLRRSAGRFSERPKLQL